MRPSGGVGGVARPGRGDDVDLEALQDAFLRSAERPSAKVTRAKPPTIKAGSSLRVRKEDDAPRSARGGADTANAPPSNGGGTAAAAAAIASGTQPTSDKIGRETPRSLSGMPPDEREKGPLASASSPTGGMILNAPGVVSKSVREREVKPPAPMRIGGFAGGGSGPIGRRGDKQRLGLAKEGKSGTAAVGRGIMGGFPAVRHRSEMGLIKLGAGATSASTGAPAAAAVAVAKGNEASKRGGHGLTGGGGGKGGGNIPGDIHEENLSRISAMSPDEIADAQQEIRAALPPGALEMLLRRGRGGGGKAASGTLAPSAAAAAAVAAGGSKAGGEEKHRAGRRSPAPVATGHDDSAAPAGDEGDRSNAGGPSRSTAIASAASDAAAAAAAAGDSPSRMTTSGAPTGAQRAATAAGGIDSEEALEAALLTLPPEERAKSRWTFAAGGDAAVTAAAAAAAEATTAAAGGPGGTGGRGGGDEARVDLDGAVVVVPAGDGGGGSARDGGEGLEALHHHGDDPDKAGYTPSELVRLARSTVSGQRQLALRALAGVLRVRAACIARGQTPPHRRLPEMLPVAIRMCLDDTNPSVTSAALNATEALLGPLARDGEDEERAMQGLSWVDYQAFPCEPRPLCTPEEKKHLPPLNDNAIEEEEEEGDETPGGGEEGKTVRELSRLCYEDPCRGLLEMALLPKMVSVMKSYAGQRAADGAQAASNGGSGRLGDKGGFHGAARATAAAASAAVSFQPRAALSCLRVLCAVGGRAPWAAERVASEPGLLDAVREAFLEPRADGTLPFDLSETATTTPPSQESATSARVEGKARRGRAGGPTGSPPPPQEQLALLAVRLAKVLVQSGRGVALALSRTPLLGSTKGWLALGQGSRRTLPALEAVQREVLELWRCCLSYGIDVAAADTVVLVARGQGWWPGLSGGVGDGAAAAPPVADAVIVERGGGGGGGGGGSGGRGGDSLPPRLAFYRALHQLACACVLPPGGDAAGRNENNDAETTGGGGGKAGVGAAGAGAREETEIFSVGGVAVVPESWADVGDTVDAAVEAALLWLLSGARGGGGGVGGGTPETAQQAAAVHLVACWVERYQAMSRTAGRRASRHLESTVEDAAVLFSSLLASPALPLPAAVAAAAAVHRGGDQPGGGGSGGDDSFSQRGVSSSEAAAAAAAAGLDWLSGVFRLGLACERAVPGEAAAALASAPEATAAALAAFLTTAGTTSAAIASPPAAFLRRVRRADAGARWLGCRLLALGCRGGVRGAGWPWAALRRDCALQAMALCERGDEAIAVGLLAEALPGSTVDRPAQEGSKRPSDDPAVAASAATAATAGASASLLRTLFRGAISDPVALSQSSFHLDGRWASLQSLKACAPPGTASLLPLPPHWLFLPLASQGGEKAAATAVSACLSLLVQLEREESAYVWGGGGRGGTGCVSPEVKLYHLANACLYGASVLSGLGAVHNFDWLFSRYLEQCGAGFEGRLTEVIARLALASAPDPAKMIADAAADAAAGGGDNSNGGDNSSARDRARAARRQSHAERALLEFVKDLVASFLADSFGLPSFAGVLRVFVRTGFPAAARRVVWKELGDVGLLHLLDPPPPAGPTAPATSVPSPDSVLAARAIAGGGSVTNEAYLCPPDVDGAIVEAYLTALEHPRFGPAAPAGERRRHGREEGTEGGSALSAGTAAARGLGVRAGHDDSSSAAAGAVTMREIAVHHLAFYLFPPSPRPAAAAAAAAAAASVAAGGAGSGDGGGAAPVAPCLPECGKDNQGESPWRPDFARRKMFERLLRQHRENLGRGRGEAGAGTAGSVAAAVLGHHGLGVDNPAVVAADQNRETGERPTIQGEGGAWVSELGERRRKLLQAYCRASSGDGRSAVAVAGDGGGDGDGSGEVDVVSWLEEGRHVEDAVERLAREVCP